MPRRGDAGGPDAHPASIVSARPVPTQIRSHVSGWGSPVKTGSSSTIDAVTARGRARVGDCEGAGETRDLVVNLEVSIEILASVDRVRRLVAAPRIHAQSGMPFRSRKRKFFMNSLCSLIPDAGREATTASAASSARIPFSRMR